MSTCLLVTDRPAPIVLVCGRLEEEGNLLVAGRSHRARGLNCWEGHLVVVEVAPSFLVLVFDTGHVDVVRVQHLLDAWGL